MRSSIAALILGAGLSKRMRQPKLFINIKGYPMFYHSILAVKKTSINDIILVVGKYYQETIAYLNLLEQDQFTNVVINHQYEKGMSSSIICGISNIPSSADAELILLADMPFISHEIIRLVISCFEHSNANNIIIPIYKGKRGHPVLIPKYYFKELMNLQDDVGARHLISKYQHNVKTIEVSDKEILTDFDTYKDIQKWQTSL